RGGGLGGAPPVPASSCDRPFPDVRWSSTRVASWLRKIARWTASGWYARNTSSSTWKAAHRPRLTPQAVTAAGSRFSVRPRYTAAARQNSPAARASHPIAPAYSPAWRPRGTSSGSITWLIHRQFPETNLNDPGITSRAASASRTFVAATTLSQAAQNTRTARLIPDRVTHVRIATPFAPAVPGRPGSAPRWRGPERPGSGPPPGHLALHRS